MVRDERMALLTKYIERKIDADAQMSPVDKKMAKVGVSICVDVINSVHRIADALEKLAEGK